MINQLILMIIATAIAIFGIVAGHPMDGVLISIPFACTSFICGSIEKYKK